MIRGKIFLWELWKRRLNWDYELQNEDLLKWISIQTELKSICECEIQMSIVMDCVTSNVEYKLLCFCDASASAYAVAIYLHQTSANNCKCDLIFSKSRLAPVKKLTIPRLELMAVLIGVRCVTFVKSELNLNIEKMYMWTDSQCVLRWITSKKDLNVFVKNRIMEIQSHKDINFMYVCSKENPADIATRGTSTKGLFANTLWWHGPDWLKRDVPHWKMFSFEERVSVQEDLNSELINQRHSIETSSLICSNDYAVSEVKAPYGIDCKRFSSYSKLLRVTAWIDRFLAKLRKTSNKSGNILTCEDISAAEFKWLKFVQRKQLSDVYCAILECKPNNLRQLGIFKGEDGLLRCRGRLENADISEAARLPILLSRGEDLTHLIIENVHKEQFHSGVSQMLSKLRHKYWIPQGRSTVRQVLRRCLVCRKYEGGPYRMPPMAPYPRSKVSRSVPFSNTGLDYLGPIYVRCNKEIKKRWICLFTCVVTRAFT